MPLFWKYLISLWSILLLSMLAAYIVTLALDRGPHAAGRHLALQKSLDETNSYVGAYGINGLTQSPELLSISHNIEIEVSDSDAKIISSLNQSKQTEQPKPPVWSTLFTRIVSDSATVQDPEGNALTITARTRLSAGQNLQSLIRRPLIPLGVFVVVSGLLSLLFSRYLFGPLKHIRHVASLLADGHVGARVRRSTTRRWDGFGRLATDFNRMSDRLEQGFQQQQRIVRELNQELMTPYGQIRDSLEIAQLDPTDERLEAVKDGVTNLQKVINHGIALSGDENTRPLEQHALVEIVDLVSNVVREADYVATQDSKHVRLHLATPVWVRANERLIEQAVENVIRNAVHYSKTGGVIDVEIRSQRQNLGENYVDICVNDQGPAVADEVLAIRLHDGTIIARNRVDDDGLRIVIRLPMADPADIDEDERKTALTI